MKLHELKGEDIPAHGQVTVKARIRLPDNTTFVKQKTFYYIGSVAELKGAVVDWLYENQWLPDMVRSVLVYF